MIETSPNQNEGDITPPATNKRTLVNAIFLVSTIFVAASVSIVFLVAVFVLPTLPGRLDEILLTNNEFCYTHHNHPHSSEGNCLSGDPPFFSSAGASSSTSNGKIHIDYGDYDIQNIDFGTHDTANENIKSKGENEKKGAYYFSMEYFSWKLALYLWELTNNDDFAQHSTGEKTDGTNDRQVTFHPMCREYRKFRSRLRFQEFLVPWNWYNQCKFRVKGFSLRAPADVLFVPRKSLDSTDHNDRVGSNYDSNPKSKANSWFMSGIHQLLTMLRGWLLSSDEYFNDVIRVDEHLAYSKNTKNATHYLPPTLQIETIEFSFRSWSRPVVSVEMRGATVNVVIQKGAIPIQLPLSVLGHGKQGDADLACQVDYSVEESADAAISIGDMTIHEVLKLLPKPPEEEGLYPRIGAVNITNVTLAIYSKPASAFSKSVTSDDDIGDSRSSSKLLTKVNIPDELFFPVANLTVANKATGIDKMHFQSLLESAFTNAFRHHILHDAEETLRKSWTKATEFTESLKDQTLRAQEQLRQLIIATQKMYLDRWVEMGVNAWHQTQESVWQGWWKVNGTAPLTKAWGEWIEDLKGMVSEPVSPLRTIVSHHWTNILEAINNNNLSIDKNILNQLSEMKHALDGTVAKSKGEIANHLKRGRSIEERISTHLTELKDSFDEFISKSSGIDAEQFLRGFEQEIKQKWLELSLDAMFFE